MNGVNVVSECLKPESRNLIGMRTFQNSLANETEEILGESIWINPQQNYILLRIKHV